ncbi:MAG TPA: hybrid sensor histidine kinase/response regulator [Verrucomicrobiae bacterium]|nr:hybrid sensor histidine kinase/response regulator [Verrucomicrobiae bacterium]
MQATGIELTATTSQLQKRTLLIVDDEEGPRQSLRVVFKDDYNLLMANDGARAIELARQNRVDVAITDIRMVGMSGVELLEQLKAVDPGIEVIMLTAYETVDTLRLALRLGACDYLNKPFDISTMRKAVANAVERRSLGEEIRNNSQQLQELQKELQHQKTTEEITRTRGEIYASIIHDINGPLTVISGFIQLMSQRIGSHNRIEGEDLDFLKDRLKTITRQVTNCIEISRRYLSFLRQNSEDTPMVGVNQILTDLHQLIRVHPSVKNNEFKIEPLSADATVKINGTDLIQILLNLAVNGFQCTPDKHSVHISGRIMQHPVDLSKFADGPEDRVLNREGFRNAPPLLTLSVKDNGPGIPADIMPKIFDPYFTTKSANQGTGLGLNVVQRLVKEAKACLHLHSGPGQGATFTIYFPTSS